MTAHYLSSYIFSGAVKIFTGKKQSVSRGKKRPGPGVKGVEKKQREEKGRRQRKTLQTVVLSCLEKKSSRLVFSHEHKNAINKAEMIYYYLREQL